MIILMAWLHNKDRGGNFLCCKKAVDSPGFQKGEGRRGKWGKQTFWEAKACVHIAPVKCIPLYRSGIGEREKRA